jgi:hypothetical protein
MAENYITRIRERRWWPGGQKNAPFLHLFVTGHEDNPDTIEFQALSSRAGQIFLPTDHVGQGNVTVPLLHRNTVRMEIPGHEQQTLVIGPLWHAFEDHAASLGLEHIPTKHSATGMEIDLAERPLVLSTGGETHEVSPAAFVAAGLRLVHAHQTLGRP